jgi:hypothetical protein
MTRSAAASRARASAAACSPVVALPPLPDEDDGDCVPEVGEEEKKK